MSERANAGNGAATPPIIRIRGLTTRMGNRAIHRNLDLDVQRGEVLGVVGGSGTGKSVLLRVVVGLIPPHKGTVEVFSQDISKLDSEGMRRLEARWGVLFQDGALFSSLTVTQNIQVPLKEHLKLPQHLMDEIAAMKVALVGLPPDTGAKYPAELSGGMRKRASLARALALDPELLFLDEPTAGLDPIGAAAFDALIRDLQKSLGLTVFLVTHDLDTLMTICDRIAVLVDKRIKIGTMTELLHDTHPWIHAYFHGPRGRAALAAHGGAQEG
ncbi:MAG TPA: ABC transporter ATP-binding protein [Stellaceae bacterium]|jgi:phospholipid/cholesterol/gamma-HCH transport system ATP-binding protein|nr:ABC transporter ATP-binding protein [Stellaceae bacterium]